MVAFIDSSCDSHDCCIDSSVLSVLDLQRKNQCAGKEEVHLHDRGIQTRSMVLGVPENVPQTLDHVLPYILRV